MVEDRERMFREWMALRAACNTAHAAHMKGGIGGAVICVCGQGCGGCPACNMLKTIKSFITYCDTRRMKAADRQWIELMRLIV